MSPPFVLVHGACHGAWCWDGVVHELETRGHRVTAVDLPGRAGCGKAGWKPTLEAYAAAVVDAAAAYDEPVIAVGHSMGGQVIAASAERDPARFAHLIYLAAFMPLNGDSVVALGRHDQGSELASATKVSLLRGQVAIRSDAAATVFYGDCLTAEVRHAIARLEPESLRPSYTRIRLTDARHGAIPKSYIRLTEDRVVTPQFQDWMIGRQRCQRVVSLRASHSPFFSMPLKLTETILDVAGT